MSLKYSLILFCLFGCALQLEAQIEKTIHQTFEIEALDALSVDLVSDSTFLVTWPGTTILTETKVKLYDASPSIMEHFMDKEQRYLIEADTVGNELRLFSPQKERKPIRTRSGECPEYVYIRVFVPNEFKLEGENKMVRSE